MVGEGVEFPEEVTETEDDADSVGLWLVDVVAEIVAEWEGEAEPQPETEGLTDRDPVAVPEIDDDTEGVTESDEMFIEPVAVTVTLPLPQALGVGECETVADVELENDTEVVCEYVEKFIEPVGLSVPLPVTLLLGDREDESEKDPDTVTDSDGLVLPDAGAVMVTLAVPDTDAVTEEDVEREKVGDPLAVCDTVPHDVTEPDTEDDAWSVTVTFGDVDADGE
jgi:hypothetical protein